MTDKDPRDMSFEEWDRWRRETGRINRGPLSREESIQWLVRRADQNPTAKEREVRQTLAAMRNLNDQLKGDT
ncbi:hypothetical protein [Microbacterium immunditiarum]|uniref:Uncharacterized protein n=1 Tax=Microbacterium immunditiarum TaxID=337480 RepID=A0A7Y9KHG9_9MICO|nr:hypothetical protein [Microbacterium immunditiarum]NYE19462.1 hypothetical protein [Microbacterium immunditiarum]